jgi:D-aspartate ligase
MVAEKIPLERFRPERPPAVVLGDLSLIRPVAMASIPLVLATPEPNDVALRSRHVAGYRVVPAFDDPSLDRAAEAIVDLGAMLHRALGRKVPLFYNSDKNLELIYRHREALAAHYLLRLNDEAIAWALHRKDLFYPLAERAGVRVPRTLQSSAAIDTDLEALRDPVLVKPKTKTAWRAIQRDLFEGHGKARVFFTKRALRHHPSFARHRDAVVVQEFLGGDVASLYSFHGYVGADGRLLAAYCGRKIRTFPAFAGESCFIELVKDADVDRVGRDVVRRLGLKGVFKIDLVRDGQTGMFYTLEVNARFNLWNHLGAACGVNLPAIAYDDLVAGQAPAADPVYVPHYRWVNLYRDYLAFREQRGRGTLGPSAWLGSLASPWVLHETFAWHDPGPFAQWAGEFVRGWWAQGREKEARRVDDPLWHRG